MLEFWQFSVAQQRQIFCKEQAKVYFMLIFRYLYVQPVTFDFMWSTGCSPVDVSVSSQRSQSSHGPSGTNPFRELHLSRNHPIRQQNVCRQTTPTTSAQSIFKEVQRIWGKAAKRVCSHPVTDGATDGGNGVPEVPCGVCTERVGRGVRGTQARTDCGLATGPS